MCISDWSSDVCSSDLGVLGVRHHLLRHAHDVAVAQVGLGGGDEPGEVVARSHLGDALDGEDLETCAHAASTAVARAAAVAGSRMIVGTTTQQIGRAHV